MRSVAKSILVFLVTCGLMVPQSMAISHEVVCATPEACVHEAAAELEVDDLAELLPADDCQAEDWKDDFSDCEHHHSDEDEHHHDDSSAPHHHHEDGPHHHHDGDSPHHHHHQCACSAANAWLIADSGGLALIPPFQPCPHDLRDQAFPPESPVFLLDQPPRG